MDIEIMRFGVPVDGMVISRSAAEHAAEELRQRDTLKIDGKEYPLKGVQLYCDEHAPNKGVVVASVYMPQHPLDEGWAERPNDTSITLQDPLTELRSDTGWIELFTQGKVEE